jgi:hypothetical protein
MPPLAREQGHDVRLFQYFPHLDHHLRAVEEAGVTLVDFHKRRKFDPGVVVALLRTMRRERPDAVVSFLAGPSAFAAAAARIAGVPVIASERGSFRWGACGSRACSACRRARCAHVTANSIITPSAVQEFPTRRPGSDDLNGIDTDRFRPASTTARAPAGAGSWRVDRRPDRHRPSRERSPDRRTRRPEIRVEWQATC